MALNKPDQGYMAAPKNIKVNDFMLFGDRVHRIHRIIAHRFRMGDVEDPDLMAGEPLWRWQESEMGQWVMNKSVDTPEWHRQIDHTTYGYQYVITAKLKDKDYTFWQLKWADQVPTY